MYRTKLGNIHLCRYLILLMLVSFQICLAASVLEGGIPRELIRPDYSSSIASSGITLPVKTDPEGSWTAYTNPYNFSSMYEDNEYIWFGSPFGVYRYDRVNMITEVLNTANSGLNSNFVTDIAKDSYGNYWFSHLVFIGDGPSCGGISILHADGSWSALNYQDAPFESNIISCLEFDSDGKLWIGYSMNNMSQGGLSSYDPATGNWQYYSKQNSSLPSNTVMSITHASDNTLWITFCGDVDPNPYVGGGLLHITASGWEAYNTQIADDPAEPLKEWYIKNILEDSQGNMWFCLSGSVDTGLFMFDGDVFTKISTDQSNMYWEVAIDSLDGIYVNTIIGEVIRYDNNTWDVLADPENLATDHFLQNIFMDSTDRLWVALYDDILIAHDGSQYLVPQLNVNSPMKGLNSYWDITADTFGNTYFGSGWYLWGEVPQKLSMLEYRNEEWISYNYSDYQNYVVNDISFDAQGDLLIATGDANSDAAPMFDMYGSICRKTADGWIKYDYDNTGYPFVYAGLAQEDYHGNLWAGTTTEGMAVYDGNSWTILNTDTQPGLYSNTITDILALHDQPIVWVATVAGVYRVDISDPDAWSWQYFHPGNSAIPGWQANDFVLDNSGILLVCTNCGVARYENGTWVLITALDGIDVLDMSVDENNELWLGTLDLGLIRYTDSDYYAYTRDNSPLPTDHIAKVESDKQGRLWVHPFSNGLYCLNYGYSDVPEEQIGVPVSMVQNYPNPFNPSTTISFNMIKGETAELGIFNTRGQMVRNYGRRHYAKGTHQLVWDGKDQSGTECGTGIYLVRFKTESFLQSHKMTLVK